MYNRGFTAFFAVLIASLTLAVGISIYDLLSRELALSQTAAQSQYAIFAADTAAECGLYWDSKAPVLNGAPSIFATSSVSSWGGATNTYYCNQLDITTQGPPAVDLSQYTNAVAYNCSVSTAWCKVSTALAATTTFSVTFPSKPYCAIVVVTKYATAGNPPKTSITSHGFNNCVSGGVTRLERALQVNY